MFGPYVSLLKLEDNIRGLIEGDGERIIAPGHEQTGPIVFSAYALTMHP